MTTTPTKKQQASEKSAAEKVAACEEDVASRGGSVDGVGEMPLNCVARCHLVKPLLPPTKHKKNEPALEDMTLNWTHEYACYPPGPLALPMPCPLALAMPCPLAP